MQTIFLENVFVRKDFRSTIKKTSYKNKPAFEGTQGKPTPHRILEM